MLYLDTAVVLTLFVNENTSETVENWLMKQPLPLAFSDWGLTECASAMALKSRRGDLSPASAANAFSAMTEFARESCVWLVCAPRHQSTAQEMLGRHNVNLRAGDALHLAISHHAGATLVTYDRQLLASAATLGIATADPLTS